MTFRKTAWLMPLLCIGLGTTGCSPVTHQLSDIQQTADAALDAAEHTLPKIADHLNATITSAHGFAGSGGGIEGTSPTLNYTVEGSMSGPKPTQRELEQTMAEVGCTDITASGGGMWEGTDEAPQALCERPGQDMRISVSFSDLFAETKGAGFSFSVWDPKAQFTVRAEDLSEFTESNYRDFDQSLVTPLDGE